MQDELCVGNRGREQHSSGTQYSRPHHAAVGDAALEDGRVCCSLHLGLLQGRVLLPLRHLADVDLLHHVLRAVALVRDNEGLPEASLAQKLSDRVFFEPLCGRRHCPCANLASLDRILQSAGSSCRPARRGMQTVMNLNGSRAAHEPSLHSPSHPQFALSTRRARLFLDP